jgi:hypothetical protein
VRALAAFLVSLLIVTVVMPAGVRAQVDEAVAAARADLGRAGATLDTLESLLAWPAPAAEADTDVRVMTRSVLAFVPLPLVRLTADANGQIVAQVTEWQAPGAEPDPAPAPRVFTFAHLPAACNDDRSLCAGAPQTLRVPEAKAMWFALLIARGCNDQPRLLGTARGLTSGNETHKVRSDAEDLFVRGRVGGVPMLFSCRGPNPKGATPGDRQAAAVLRIAHHLLGR